MRKSKGITLIALVITIVVLIILAGVAINLTLGENGVFRKASKAKEDTQVAQNEESKQLAETTNSIDDIVASGRDTISINKEEYEQIKQQIQSLTTTEDYTDYQINSSYIDTSKSNVVSIKKVGKTVCLTYSLYIKSSLSNGSYEVITNMPILDSNTMSNFIGRDDSANKITMCVTAAGTLNIYWNSATVGAGRNIAGTVTYMCK